MSLIAVAPSESAAELRSRRDGPTVAVLVDSENFPAAFLGRVVEAAEEIGRANIRKGFANCNSSNTQEWRSSPYAAFAVTPIHIPTTTTGKNASDIALAMTAMDIAHLRLAEVVCIASSDGDFAMLAHRLRELGVAVVGFGSARSPAAWVAACDRFEVVYAVEAPSAREGRTDAAKPAPATAAPAVDKHVAPVAASVDAWMGPERMRALSSLGLALRNAIPGFEPRNYGFSQLRKLVHSLPGFEVIAGAKGSPNSPRVRRTDDATGQEAPPTTASASEPAHQLPASEGVASDWPLVVPTGETDGSDPAIPSVDISSPADQPIEGEPDLAALVAEFMGAETVRDYSQLGMFLRRHAKGFTPSRRLRSLVSELGDFDVVQVGTPGRKPVLNIVRAGASGSEARSPSSVEEIEKNAGPSELPTEPEVTVSERRDVVLAVASTILADDATVTPRQLWGRLRARFSTLKLAELGVENVRGLLETLRAQPTVTPTSEGEATEVADGTAAPGVRRAPRRRKGDA